MKQDAIRLNGTYQLKPEVAQNSVQVDGQPFRSHVITITRVKFPAGRKTAWFYDFRGNAYRASDFSHELHGIDVEF